MSFSLLSRVRVLGGRAVLLAAMAAPVVSHADQSLAGNVTVTGGSSSGNLFVTGVLDADGNSLTFGTQGTSPGVTFTYADDSLPGGTNDTQRFSLYRTSASWLWTNGTTTSVPAMRLDSAHQLVLYQADGTTAGVTLTPATTSLKLGTATLTASGTTLTTGGAVTITSGLTVGGSVTFNGTGFTANSAASQVQSLTTATINGKFASGGLTIAAATSGNNGTLTLSAVGTGDMVFNTNGTERARIKSAGNFIISPTTSTATKLQVNGRSLFSGGVSDPADATPAGVAVGYNTTGNYGFVDAVQSGAGGKVLVLNASGGKVGVGTTTPATGLSVAVSGTGEGLTVTENGTAGVTNLFLSNGSANSAARNWLLATNLDGNGSLSFRRSNASGGSALTAGTAILTLASSGTVAVTATTVSTTPADGALVVAGGAGVGGNVNVAGALKVGGAVRFDSAVRIAPQGDLSMGEFTTEP